MNPEIFGDEFWETVVCNCPDLSSISLVPVHEETVSSMIASFTDRSLRAIAKHSYVWFCEMDYVNVTGDGISDLAIHHAPPKTSRNRSYHITLGDRSHDTTDTRFYDTVTRFLERLIAEEGCLPCMAHKSSTVLKNGRQSEVRMEWSKTYLETLKSLIQQAKTKHPDVVLNIVAHDCDGMSFSQIIEFAFDTHKELREMWTEEDDILVDESIWNRDKHAEEVLIRDVFSEDGSGDERHYFIHNQRLMDMFGTRYHEDDDEDSWNDEESDDDGNGDELY